MNDSPAHANGSTSLYPMPVQNTSGERGPFADRRRVGLLVANFGGPETVDDVESFLFNLFDDPEVIKLPLGRWFQHWLAGRISRRRAPVTADQYRQIGGGSPLNPMTWQQVDALRQALGPDAPPIYVAMRYTRPTTFQAVQEMTRDGIDGLVCLALYPHFSFTTAGSSFRVLAEELAAAGLRIPVRFIPAWYTEPGYRAAMAGLIRKKLTVFTDPERVHLLFSAHGLPASYVKKGDPYQRQVQESVRDVIGALGWHGAYSLAYQSKVGSMRWLGPSTDQEITRLAAEGARSVLVIPVSFVSDHIETLYEIDRLFGAHAREVGITEFHRTDALNTHPAFIDALAKVTRRALGQEWKRLCTRCLLPKETAHFQQESCPDCGFRTAFP